MQPRIWINSITFSDNSTIELNKDDVVVIVGPNNAGKSATLRGLKEKLYHDTAKNPVVSAITILKEGNDSDVISWLDSTTRKTEQPNSDHVYHAFGIGIHISQAKHHWGSEKHSIDHLSQYFCHLLTADERLQAANPPDNISLTESAPQHPIHYIQRNDELEKKLSSQFKKAFGVELIVHRNAGNKVPVHVGKKPLLDETQDRVSLAYNIELEKLPTLHTQGDGMRSFAGVLLNTAVGARTIVLVDEPEAFLHPPQASFLGQMMVQDKRANRQLFISTHSGDVLRGVLNANCDSVRVIRLRREENKNLAKVLNNNKVKELWSDPLLRYSNILDGVFHEKVIVCEGDADCRFYSAILNSVLSVNEDEVRTPDIMFTHCGGKGRIPLVVRALRSLDIPVVAVVDFDVFNDERPLRDIVEAAGGDWALIEKDWKEVKAAIESKKPELNSDEVKRDIEQTLSQVTQTSFPRDAKRKIEATLKRASPWAIAKSVGTVYIPNGQPSAAFERMSQKLETWGIFPVKVGEIEQFSKTTGNHGPAWVNEVLKKDLKNDAELSTAREFVKRFVGIT